MRLKPNVLGLLMLLGLASCAPLAEQRAGFFVFGTLVEVVVRDTEPERAERAFAEIQEALQAMHRDWHAWEPGELSTINSAFSEGRRVRASPDIHELLRLSREMENASQGHFNAAAGGLIRLWGFHTSEYPVTGPPPGDAEIQEWLEAAPSTADISASGEWLESANPAVQLDFGGIAKGYAADRIVDLLASHGIDNAMVNLGGDLRAVGGTAQAPWRVGIRQPGAGVAGGIEIFDADAVFTSGIDQRYRQQDGQRYPHILDPRTGRTVRGLASVTVIDRQGWRADAAATALMVAGVDGWKSLADRMGLDAVLVIDEQGRHYATPAMADRLQFRGTGEVRLQVVGNP